VADNIIVQDDDFGTISPFKYLFLASDIDMRCITTIHKFNIEYLWYAGAARLCWSVGMKGDDTFLKFGSSSSRCKSYPTNAEPGQWVASLASVSGNGIDEA